MTTIIEFVTPYLDAAIARDPTDSDLFTKAKEKFLETVTDKDIPIPTKPYVLDGALFMELSTHLNKQYNSYDENGWFSSKRVTPPMSNEFKKLVRCFMEDNEDQIKEWWHQRELENVFVEELKRQGKAQKEGIRESILSVIPVMITRESAAQFCHIVLDFNLYTTK